MPLDPDAPRFPQERLPDDKPGIWECPSAICGRENTGPISAGCAFCGAGTPGRQATGRQPSYEEVTGQQEPPVAVPFRQPRLVPATGSLADRLMGKPTLTLEAIRQVLREELASLPQGGGFRVTPQEKFALLEGLQIVANALAQAPDLSPEERAQFPDALGLAELTERIQAL